MSIARNILKWTDKKFDEVCYEDVKHPGAKAFGLGMIEGFVDGAIIAYPVVVGMAICKIVYDAKHK